MINTLIMSTMVACLIHCGESFNWEKADELRNGKGSREIEDQFWTDGQSGVVDTCRLQKDVISITVTPRNEPTCFMNAGYEACLTLHLKTHATVEKTCVKDPNALNPPDFSAYNASYYWNSHVGFAMGNGYWEAAGLLGPDAPTINGQTQCQRGCGGKVLMFAIKDGYRCAPTAVSGIPDYANITGVTVTGGSLPLDVGIECRSRLAWNSMTNNPADKIGSCICAVEKEECVWKVSLPIPPFEVSSDPSPSPSPCGCPDGGKTCNDAIDDLIGQGYTNEADILNCGNPDSVAQHINAQGDYGCQVQNLPCSPITCEKPVPQKILDDFSHCAVKSK